MPGPERQPRGKSLQSNPYKPSCTLCTRVQTCEPCAATSGCAECTSTARCGSCRNVYSRYRRTHASHSPTALSGRHGSGSLSLPRLRLAVAVAVAVAVAELGLNVHAWAPSREDRLPDAN